MMRLTKRSGLGVLLNDNGGDIGICEVCEDVMNCGEACFLLKAIVRLADLEDELEQTPRCSCKSQKIML